MEPALGRHRPPLWASSAWMTFRKFVHRLPRQGGQDQDDLAPADDAAAVTTRSAATRERLAGSKPRPWPSGW